MFESIPYPEYQLFQPAGIPGPGQQVPNVPEKVIVQETVHQPNDTYSVVKGWMAGISMFAILEIAKYILF
jgi:hypothetical protein